MNFLAKLQKIGSNEFKMDLIWQLIHRFLWIRDLQAVASHQLILVGLGNDPQAVMEFLTEEIQLVGVIDGPEELPELPWCILDLPVGSDTFSIIHILADKLERRGAVVRVTENQEVD